jgi:hypothetical protein
MAYGRMKEEYVKEKQRVVCETRDLTNVWLQQRHHHLDSSFQFKHPNASDLALILLLSL